MKLDNHKLYDKLEYKVSENTEIFILTSTKLGYSTETQYDFSHIFLRILNLKDDEYNKLKENVGPVAHILSFESKTYDKEKDTVKAKIYIDKTISDPFFKKKEIFKLACELKYFKQVMPHKFYDLSSLEKKQISNVPKYDFERIEYIYNYCQQKKIKVISIYEITDFEDFIVASITEILNSSKTILKCKNCGRYFLAKRNDAEYCDNPSPQNENKTCKEYAPSKKYEDNLDEADQLYRKIYKTLNQAKNRNSFDLHIKNFENFKEEAKQWKLKIKNGEKTKEEYLEWLKQKTVIRFKQKK